MIEIENVSKCFGKKVALKNVSLSFQSGICGLLGQNGAGKTTLMRILSTILDADSGTIRLNGEICNKSHMRQNIGYLPQQFSMYKGLSVEESLRHISVLKNIAHTDALAEIDKVLEAVNLSDRRKSKIGSLSGGMLRRVGIAQALLGNPALLIVDEPTAGLDPEERLRFRDLLSDIGSDRMILISTHIVEDIEAVCDYAGILAHGIVLTQGTLEELKNTVKGKVWEVETKNKINPDNHIWIVSQKKQESGFLCRLISDQEIMYGKRVEETLEDAYIYLNGRKQDNQ